MYDQSKEEEGQSNLLDGIVGRKDTASENKDHQSNPLKRNNCLYNPKVDGSRSEERILAETEKEGKGGLDYMMWTLLISSSI